PDDRGAGDAGPRAADRVRLGRNASDPVPRAPVAGRHGGAARPRDRRLEPAAKRVRGGRRALEARAARAHVARGLAGGLAGAAQAGTPRAAALARRARRGRDRAHALRRAAAGARTPETVRPAAVRVARVLPSP